MNDVGALIVLSLAVYRVTHALVVENGPWEILETMRYLASLIKLDGLVTCPWCVSVWISAIIALSVTGTVTLAWVVYGLAGSAGCMIVWRVMHGQVSNQRESDSAGP